ncbi:hypothetical protein KAW18_03580 [candidate division WOR-3 bacterium]|nr:hypothetical protein [Candidatus Parcubacteria bacterium]MCK4526427.1 hypothetical protein [candidate division WOR-3 bacterium]
MSEKLSIFNALFWDLWLMKHLRNIASVKYQFMVAFFMLIVYGMFNIGPSGVPWIPAVAGLSFLGGGFIALATSRIISKTRLTENEDLDTDK